MSKVADKKHDHKHQAGVGNHHKAHGPKHHKPKPTRPHVTHVHNTINNNTTINFPTAPVEQPQQLPEYGPLLGANQDLYNGFNAFLGSLFGSLVAPQPPVYSFPQYEFPSYPAYPTSTTSWPSAPAYPSNGSAGGWSAWGAARGAY